MSEQPRVGDRVRVTGEFEFAGRHGEWSDGRGRYAVRLGDGATIALPLGCEVEVLPPPRCRASEGATGIECDLPKGHAIDVDHEGTHDPSTATHDGVGYRITVRWPWQQYDRDYADVALPEPEVIDAKTLFPPPAGTAPRVFESDGPEPPETVTVLERLDYPPGRRFPYAKRGQFGWVNCETADDDTSGVHGFAWPPGHAQAFREVVQP